MVVVVVAVVVVVVVWTQANIVMDAYEVEEEEIVWFVGTSSVDLVAQIMIPLLLLLSRRTMTMTMMVRIRKCNNDNDYAVLASSLSISYNILFTEKKGNRTSNR